MTKLIIPFLHTYRYTIYGWNQSLEETLISIIPSLNYIRLRILPGSSSSSSPFIPEATVHSRTISWFMGKVSLAIIQRGPASRQLAIRSSLLQHLHCRFLVYVPPGLVRFPLSLLPSFARISRTAIFDTRYARLPLRNHDSNNKWGESSVPFHPTWTGAAWCN